MEANYLWTKTTDFTQSANRLHKSTPIIIPHCIYVCVLISMLDYPLYVRTETLWAKVRHREDNVVVAAGFREVVVVDADLSSYRLFVGFVQRCVQTALKATVTDNFSHHKLLPHGIVSRWIGTGPRLSCKGEVARCFTLSCVSFRYHIIMKARKVALIFTLNFLFLSCIVSSFSNHFVQTPDIGLSKCRYILPQFSEKGGKTLAR